MITTIHLIMMFLPYIFHIINCYFKFINPSWLLNNKQQPFRNFWIDIEMNSINENLKLGSSSQQTITYLKRPMKRLVQWQHDIHKSIKTSYQIYAAILLQKNIGEKQSFTPTLLRFVPIPVPHLVQHLMKLISHQVLIKIWPT